MVKSEKKLESLKFVTDHKGKKVGVLLSLKFFEELLEDIYDAGVVLRRKDEDVISFEEIKKKLNV